MGVKELLKQLKNPPKEFTPVPFWFFNDSFDREKVRRQLEGYMNKGVSAIVFHPRIGIPKEIPYLSEAYFEVVRYVVETAAQLDMKVVLYDEGMYPSGSAHGMVVAKNPDYAARGITITEEPEQDPIIAVLTGGRYLVKRVTKGTIRGIHFGEDDGEEGAPAAADILNPKAVELFIHLTHDRYYEELKSYFGNTVMGFFTDEPCALGRNAEAFREWAEGLDWEIREEGGQLEELEGLFTGKENMTTAIYRRLIKKHLRETFYGALSRWCEGHGIWLMGHPAESDDVEEELYFHVPGQDLIMRRVAPETGGLLEPDSVQAKLAADIARHLGRRRNSNECFGVCCRENVPWYFTGMDMKWYLNWMGIRGVNLFIPHAFYYSVEGKRSKERPPDVGPNNIWWKHYNMFSDYMKRISFLMTDSVNGAKVAVICDNNRIPFREIAVLYESQIEFNYLPAALLSSCHVEKGILCIREYRYEVVLNVLGEEYDTRIRKAQGPCGQEKYAGVKIVHRADEIQTDGLQTVKTLLPCADLRAVRLYKEEAEMYLLSNEGRNPIHTRLFIPGGASPLCVDLWKGASYPARIVDPVSVKEEKEGVELEIELFPCEMLLVVNKGLEADETKCGSAELAGMVRRSDETWNDRFALIGKEDNRAEYSCCFLAQEITGREVFEITGEEMAECWCNGQFLGVSFYSPHRFETGPFLKKGENEIRLVFTGNAANQYESAGLMFGLESVD